MEEGNSGMPVISIIIPTKNRSEILLASLNELMKATVFLTNFEVIIVDDGSDVLVNLPSDARNFKVVRNIGKGVASARNYGAGLAKSELLWFLDDDIWINEAALKRALHLNSTNSDAIFNFNWVYPPYLNEVISKIPFGRFLQDINFTTMKGWSRGNYWDDNELFKTDWLAGATLLVSKSIYNKVNGYDSSFPLAGFEDHDFSVRVKKAKVQCYIDPVYLVYHNEVNKTSLRGFLERVRNNAVTRKHAVNIGHIDQKMNYTKSKVLAYRMVGFIEFLLMFVVDHWPNVKLIDKLYFRLCHILIGYNNFIGYNSIP